MKEETDKVTTVKVTEVMKSNVVDFVPRSQPSQDEPTPYPYGPHGWVHDPKE